MAKLKKTASGPRTRAARKPRGKYEIIRNKIEEVKSLDYSRWKAGCVAEHFISAGRMRLTKHELYGFPSYCRFPYNSYENDAHNLNILPFRVSDEDAPAKLRCLLNGKLAYYEMRSQHRDYVRKFLSKHVVRKNPKPKRQVRNRTSQSQHSLPQPSEQIQPNAGVAPTPDTNVTPANANPVQPASVQIPADSVDEQAADVAENSAAVDVPPVQPTSVRIPANSVDEQAADVAENSAAVDGLPARSPLAQSTPVRPVANPTVMPDADDHTPTRSRDQQVSNQQVNLDFGDDDDELFDGNPAVGPLPLPAAVQQRLSDIQSQMDPDARARLQRLSDSLNNHEIERVQPVQPDPNEVRPIRRRRPNRQPRANPPRRNLRRRGGPALEHAALVADADIMVDLDNFQALNLGAINEEELPPFVDDGQQLPANQQNTVNAVQQIDLNDDIEIQPVPAPEIQAVNVAQNGNRVDEEQVQQQQQQQQQQDQQQQQQQSIDELQGLPNATVNVLPTDHRPNPAENATEQNLQAVSAVVNAVQPNAPLATSTRTGRPRRRNALGKAIAKLGRIRKRSKPRRMMTIDMAAFDLCNLVVQRIPEEEYKLHPHLQPEPDLTKYFELIFEMVCRSDYVHISDYISRQWTRFERSCALSALTMMASEDYIRIDTNRRDASANLEIVGFELPTD